MPNNDSIHCLHIYGMCGKSCKCVHYANSREELDSYEYKDHFKFCPRCGKCFVEKNEPAIKEIKYDTKILRNSAKCLKCGDEIESKSVHDFVSCKCGAISVDGGHEYLRRVGDSDAIEDSSMVKKFKIRNRHLPFSSTE